MKAECDRDNQHFHLNDGNFLLLLFIGCRIISMGEHTIIYIMFVIANNCMVC